MVGIGWLIRLAPRQRLDSTPDGMPSADFVHLLAERRQRETGELLAPDTRWGRAFGVAWMIAGVVVFSMFTASAASLLTSRQLRSFVGDWDDLKTLRVGTVEQSDAQEYLRASGIDSTGYPTPVDLLEELRQRRIDAAVFGRAGLVDHAKTWFRNEIVVLPLGSPPHSWLLATACHFCCSR